MRNKKNLFMAQASMIAAIYVVLTVLFAPFSFKSIQVRFAEALTILPYFTPAAIPGLFIGCVIGNVIGGAVLWDIVFGSLATLLGAIGTWLLRKQTPFLAPLSPIVSNTVIIPFVLRLAYGDKLPLLLMAATIGAGEILSCGVLGMFLLFALKKHQNKIFKRF